MALIIDINSATMTEPDYLAIIKERGQGALDIKMGIEMLEVSPQRWVARMPVEGNTQPIGILHGGANVVLAESLGSIGTQ
jgi:acyl-coenzyme A thioesterase PaaI-like protein